MTDKAIADVLRINGRFLRSAHLERDFHDPSAFDGYIVTDMARHALGRLAQGLKPRSGQRAWRLTGDYGGGKSCFALLLAHSFGGHYLDFPRPLRTSIGLTDREARGFRLVPLLVTCARQPLARSILDALRAVLMDLGRFGRRAGLLADVEEALAADAPSDDLVLGLLLKANLSVIESGKGTGLLIIIDELGKFLEYAAINSEQQDVFLLQRLAEAASRSGEVPLFVVCILHQGFSAYANHLDQPVQREWEKVAGRFEEVVFSQPLEQIALLIASALDVKTDLIPPGRLKGQQDAMRTALALGWFGTAAPKPMLDLAARLYPIHPCVVPVLVRVFRRYGQNERSLFSFLLSSEPFGLQTFCRNPLGSGPFCLHDLYDYVRTAFGHRLSVQSYRSHWNLVDSVIESFSTDDELEMKILKTVGLLNLLNDVDLIPTEEAIVWAISAHDPAQQSRVRKELEKLRAARRVLYNRGAARGFCLWPYTTADVEKAYEDATRAVDTSLRVGPYLSSFLETRPIVARRHYIETGNLRHFEIRYVTVAELRGATKRVSNDADGSMIIPLCETAAERREALACAASPEFKHQPNWLVGVPHPLTNLARLVEEVQRWEWVEVNTPELAGDKYAREEVSRQKAAARSQLEKRVQSAIGIGRFGPQSSLEWFHCGKRLKVRAGRDLLARLSDILDGNYPLAPRIHNELINRRSLSSAAAAARMRLIEKMLASASSPLLGMDPAKKPPEMSMYLSVLKRTGLHRRSGASWIIREPTEGDDKFGLLPALRRILGVLEQEPDSRVSAAHLFAELRRPPYGVRDGLIPLLLTTFAIEHEEDVAFYKDGTFLREMTPEAMLIITKAPERFEIQYCKIAGVRSALFEKILEVLELQRSGIRKVRLLDVVRPLCVFVARLPAYALTTKKLTRTALAVRDTIIEAREPARLLFTDLPVACGFVPFSAKRSHDRTVQLFVKALKGAIDELRASYPELQERLRSRIRESFMLPGSFGEFRTALAARAEQVAVGVSEPKLRAFCLRLMDGNLPEPEWLESVASYLALKPPPKWHDSDEEAFATELTGLALRFHHVESIIFAGAEAPKKSVAFRLAVTQSDGCEREQVVHFLATEEQELRRLQAQLESLLANDTRLGLAAASRAIWKILSRTAKRK